MNRSSHPEVFCKKDVLINFAKFSGTHLCQSLFLNKVASWGLQFIKKETLTRVFSCEFCEISKNIFSYRTPLMAASEIREFCEQFIWEAGWNDGLNFPLRLLKISTERGWRDRMKWSLSHITVHGNAKVIA